MFCCFGTSRNTALESASKSLSKQEMKAEDKTQKKEPLTLNLSPKFKLYFDSSKGWIFSGSEGSKQQEEEKVKKYELCVAKRKLIETELAALQKEQKQKLEQIQETKKTESEIQAKQAVLDYMREELQVQFKNYAQKIKVK